MKKIIFILVLFCICLSCFAQTNINTSISYSLHGSGDLTGYGVSFGVEKTLPKISNRFSLGFNARFTTHSKEVEFEALNSTLPVGTNSNLRMVTSGSQLEIVPAFALINSEGFSLRFHAGVLGRYEVSNSPNGYGYTTVGETPILQIENMEDFRSFDIGYISQLSMQFKVSKKSKLGIALSLQNDTNNSIITSLPISYYFSL